VLASIWTSYLLGNKFLEDIKLTYKATLGWFRISESWTLLRRQCNWIHCGHSSLLFINTHTLQNVIIDNNVAYINTVTDHNNSNKFLLFLWSVIVFFVKLIIVIIFFFFLLHGLCRLTCSGIDALPSFPGASTFSSASRLVVEGVFRESSVFHAFKIVNPILFVFDAHFLYSRNL
jgi:hypothetical protein